MAIVLAMIPGSASGIEVYPVRGVAPGLVGTGYTVVQGNEVEPFRVEVLGVLENAGPAGSLVLVRASGEAIERAGGIAAGMSGSPVYIDGRLLGAIGYGFSMADHRIALVTPAEEMLEVLDLVLGRREGGEGDTSMPEGAPPSGVPQWIAIAPDQMGPGAPWMHDGAEVWVASPVATPLVITGLGQRAMGRVRSLVEGSNLLPIAGGAAPGGAQEEGRAHGPDLRPGSAFGVQLMRGDVSLTAIGTVTHVENGGFVGFGHPFMNRGSTGLFATDVSIVATVPSVSFPFKLGNAGDVFGVVAQDRRAAVGGLIGAAPTGVRLSVRVTDEDRGEVLNFSATAAKDDLLTVPLLVIGALEALDRGIDRIGRGTGWVDMTIEGNGLPRPLARSDVHFSDEDVSARSLVELYEALLLLERNEFADADLTAVNLDVRITGARKTASVVSAAADRPSAVAGERVLVDVTLRPFRETPVSLSLPLDIPPGVPAGEATVSVRGGGSGPGSLFGDLPTDLEAGDLGGDDVREFLAIEADSLEKVMEEFESRPKSSDLVIEFYPPYYEDWEDGDYEIPVPIRTTFATGYVVEGEVTFTLSIEEPLEPDSVPAGDPSMPHPV